MTNVLRIRCVFAFWIGFGRPEDLLASRLRSAGWHSAFTPRNLRWPEALFHRTCGGSAASVSAGSQRAKTTDRGTAAGHGRFLPNRGRLLGGAAGSNLPVWLRPDGDLPPAETIVGPHEFITGEDQ